MESLENKIEQYLFNGDSAEVLQGLKDNKRGFISHRPPIFNRFMGKDWDKHYLQRIFGKSVIGY